MQDKQLVRIVKVSPTSGYYNARDFFEGKAVRVTEVHGDGVTGLEFVKPGDDREARRRFGTSPRILYCTTESINAFGDAKVGDRVFSMLGGDARPDGTNGTVCRVDLDVLPVGVHYDNDRRNAKHATDFFTLAGCFGPSTPHPVLFWKKPEIVAPPQPPRTTKKSVHLYANVYADGTLGVGYASREEADAAGQRVRGPFSTVEINADIEVPA